LPNGNDGKRIRDANGSSERLQFLAGLEAHGFAGRDADFLAGAWIAANTGLARAHIEHSEAAQLDTLALTERIFHCSKNGFDGLFRFSAAYTRLGYNGIHNVQLNHTSLLPLNGKLC
jgi:hypothetical protein